MLSTELNKPEYQTGTYAQRLALLKSKTEPALGKIRKDKIKLLQAFIGATQLRDRLASATDTQQAAAASVAEAIQPAYLAAEETFSINLADPQVAGLLASAVSVGLLTAEEENYLIGLATYPRQLWPDVTLRDVVEHFNPALTDIGEWTELTYSGTRLALTLTQSLPEPSLVRVESCESVNGQNWTAWQRIAHFYNVGEAGLYLADIPRSQLQRRIRWRGEYYAISGTVAGV
ncbi:MAG TPA: hypothetical protein DF774_02155 [Rheinheimera sp.]|uniref:hypothetical protein n=1 Tax=Rheinheimera sp. TaxID=1869214 RepID=UPI000ED5E0EE|nr:hypothetical protein [Rheinheimera sp.]HCU64543.1 hypothetical protein [Rheinheimera sp.]